MNRSVSPEEVNRHNPQMAMKMKQISNRRNGNVSFVARSITDSNEEFYVYAKYYHPDTQNTVDEYLGKLGVDIE
jgi:hypothetical protein